MLNLPLLRCLFPLGIGVAVFVRTVICAVSGWRRSGQWTGTRNVEVCQFSQKPIEAILLIIPIDLVIS
jgi:hypothetical protein